MSKENRLERLLAREVDNDFIKGKGQAAAYSIVSAGVIMAVSYGWKLLEHEFGVGWDSVLGGVLALPAIVLSWLCLASFSKLAMLLLKIGVKRSLLVACLLLVIFIYIGWSL